jgi:hypothetical protein
MRVIRFAGWAMQFYRSRVSLIRAQRRRHALVGAACQVMPVYARMRKFLSSWKTSLRMAT